MLDNNLDTIINKTYIIDKTPLNEEKIKKSNNKSKRQYYF